MVKVKSTSLDDAIQSMAQTPLRKRKARDNLNIGLAALFLVLMGAAGGMLLASLRMRNTVQEINALKEELVTVYQKLQKAEANTIESSDQKTELGANKLKGVDRQRHLLRGSQYAKTIRRAKAQSAAQLVMWFVEKWNSLLDHPHADDRVGRRAAMLALFIDSMEQAISPEDYVPWQVEFLDGNWLGDLHFDLDRDGFPAPRSNQNPVDSFSDVSICHIAMALNETIDNGHVLLMPGFRCQAPAAQMSLVLTGETLDDAMTEFARAAREQGFQVLERSANGVRLILLGASRPS